MRVGTARVDITPPVGAELCGFLAREQPSLAVHDPLVARALYLENGSERLLWLHADLIGFERAFVADVKRALGERFALPPERIVLSATHTHSGPATIRLIHCGRYDAAYLDGLRKKLLEVSARALADPAPADAFAGEARCDLAVDRRGKPTRHTDPRVGAVAWRRADGTWAAVLANYAVHHVALRADNRAVSADMAGRAAATVADRLPGRPEVLVTNGPCGNLNPPAVTSEFIQREAPPGFDQMERWGDEIAAAVVAAVERAAPVPHARIAASLSTFDLRLERFSLADVRRKASELLAAMAGQTGYVPDRYRDAIARWEQGASAYVADSAAAFAVPLDIQIVRLGPVTFVCLAAEVFSQMADQLRAHAAGPLTVVGYANGDAGYLAPEVACDEGGYEIDSAFAFYGSLPVRRGEFERLRDHVIGLIGP